MIVGLKINSIKFKFPEGKLKMFFSWEDDKFRKSTMIKSRILVPAEAVSKYGEKARRDSYVIHLLRWQKEVS
ncbi:MAG: hypothetical protein ACI4A7_01885 [Prevotella sp.]